MDPRTIQTYDLLAREYDEETVDFGGVSEVEELPQFYCAELGLLAFFCEMWLHWMRKERRSVMSDLSRKSSDKLREIAHNAREERSTIAGDSDRDAQDARDYERAGRDYERATEELKRRGE